MNSFLVVLYTFSLIFFCRVSYSVVEDFVQYYARCVSCCNWRWGAFEVI